MVKQIQAKISTHRKRIIPALITLSLLSGLIVSVLSTPNAQADYYKGCGYGYNSSAGGFGYGTGIAYGYGYLGNEFHYGYGNQVCPPAPTTTTTAVTTTTAGGGGGGGTTTTSTSTTTTTVASTTTTAPTSTTTAPPPPPQRLFAHKVHGYAVIGGNVRLAITGGGFHGRPNISSNENGTTIVVLHDYGNLLVVRVKVPFGSAMGWHTFKITLANGKSCKVNYLVK